MKLNVTVDLDALSDEYGETLSETIRNEIKYQVTGLVRKHMKERIKADEKEILARVNKLSAATLAKLLDKLGDA